MSIETAPWSQLWLCESNRDWNEQRLQPYSLIDQQDLLWCSQWQWGTIYKHWHSIDTLYVRRNVGVKRKTVYLHRELMERVEPRSTRYMREHVVDHLNGNTLDNRRCNLRWATQKQNRNNRHIMIDSLDTIMASLPQPISFEIPF